MISEELQRLADLHRQGLLTEAEYTAAKARVIGGQATGVIPATGSRLRRSSTDSWLGGVCGGLARTTGIESWIWRLAFALFALFGGSGLLAYLLLWIFMPADSSAPHL